MAMMTGGKMAPKPKRKAKKKAKKAAKKDYFYGG